MDGGLRHCIGDRDQDHAHRKEIQKSKMAVFGGLTNSCEKKRSKKQRIYIHRMLNILGMHAQIHKVKKKNQENLVMVKF